MMQTIKLFVERLMLSQCDYLTLKEKAKRYDDMIGTINFASKSDVVHAHNKLGAELLSFEKNRVLTFTIPIIEMLAKGGFYFSKEVDVNISMENELEPPVKFDSMIGYISPVAVKKYRPSIKQRLLKRRTT